MKIKLPKILLTFLLLAGITPGFSQEYNDLLWYFGQSNRGIRFDKSDQNASAANEHVGFAGLGGAAVASDPFTGNLLFYTDGSTVYDASHTAMPTGTGLLANTGSNQPVVLAVNPINNNQYFVITNSASNTTAGTLRFSIVDMISAGNAPAFTPALGDVGLKNQDIVWDDDGDGGTTPEVAFDVAAEGVIVISNDDCSGYFLIAQIRGSNRYAVWEIGTTGIVYLDEFAIGASLNAANLSYNPVRNLIAVAPSDQLKNVHILGIDIATGTLTFSEEVLNSGNSDFLNEAVYDTEWSPNGQYLYLSRHGGIGNADILQYDLNVPGSFLNSVVPTTLFRSYGLQLAPDSSIYHIRFDGANYSVGRIENPDEPAANINYADVTFLNPTVAGQQFSVFAPSMINFTPSFTTDGNTCQNTPIAFYPVLDKPADSIRWTFGNPALGTSNAYSPVFTFDQDGVQQVSMTAYYGDKPVNAIPQDINITTFDLSITGIQDEELCPEDLEAGHTMTAAVSGNSVGTVVFKWGHEAAEGESTTVFEPGVYYVVATDASGCSTYQSVAITEYKGTEQRANFWYFGNLAGIDFNLVDPTDVTSGIVGPVTGSMTAPEGCATISDRNGDLIFYTNGVQVYDKNGDLLVPELDGDLAATQSSLIVPYPGDETLFYIFTTQEIYGDGSGQFELKYAVYDIKLNNGDGGISKSSETLATDVTEKLTGTGNNVIVHEYGSNNFKIFPVDNNGIGSPVHVSEGLIHSNLEESAGQAYMEIGANNRLGVLLNDGGTNFLEIFDYVDSTSSLENGINVDLGNPGMEVYGLEFTGTNKVFVTLRTPGGGGPSKIIEVQMETDPLDLINPTRIVALTILQEIDYAGDLGAIQVSPNGQVFVAIDGSPSLGEISPNDQLGQLSTFNDNSFDLGGNTSGLGLPNFIQSIGTQPLDPSISASNACLGSATTFAVSITSPLETYTWDFGDGTSGTGATVDHTYAAAGDYTVSLVITACAGPIVTLPEPITVTIFAPPADPNSTEDSENPGTFLMDPNQVICDTPLTLKAQDITADPAGTTFTYLWSTGEATRTIDVALPGTYSVTILSPEGCPTTAETVVTDGRPTVDLGENSFLCQGDLGPTLSAFNASPNPADIVYSWEVRDASNVLVNTSTASSLVVDTSVDGTFTYSVTVTDNSTGCVNTDAVQFTINPIATTANLAITNTSCGTANGIIDVEVSTGAGESEYFVVGSSGTVASGFIPSNFNNFSIIVNSLAIDAYTLTVTNSVTGCAMTETMNISGSDGPLFSAVLDCDAIDITYAGGTQIGPMTFEVYENGNTANTIASTRITDLQVQLDDITQLSGLAAIDIRVTDSQVPTCDAFFSIALAAPASIGSHEVLYPDCNNQTFAIVNLLNVIDPGGTIYTWSSPTGTVITGAPTTSADVTPGHTYTVRLQNGNNCTDYAFVVDDYITFNPDFTIPGTECEGQQLLTATVDAGLVDDYTFSWFFNGTREGIGTTFTAFVEGDYELRAMNNTTGCEETITKNVLVKEAFTVALSNSTACNDGSTFTVTATVFPDNLTGITYQWYLGTTRLDGETSNTLVSGEAGVYSVEVGYNGICMVQPDIEVVLDEPTPSELNSDYVFCFADVDEIKEVNPGADFVSAEWRNEAGNVVSTDVIFVPTEEGKYSVTLTNANGCITRDEILVRDECLPVVEAPNAFRPTSALTANQEFRVFTRFIDVSQFEIFIFDRWGAMVFHSTDPDFGWNGGYENNQSRILQVGTYVYLIKFVSEYQPEEGIKEKRGGVTLLR